MRKTNLLLAPFRLAFRIEGDYWNAYLAKPDTMEDAKLVGSVVYAAALHPAIKDAFMAMMRKVVETFVDDMGIARIEGWGDPERAPESERSGST